jgi:hypothetical protein
MPTTLVAAIDEHAAPDGRRCSRRPLPCSRHVVAAVGAATRTTSIAVVVEEAAQQRDDAAPRAHEQVLWLGAVRSRTADVVSR